jgi:GNAT superfamily N-acetyltransferase
MANSLVSDASTLTCSDYAIEPEIRIASSDAEITATFSVMRQLRPELSEATYLPLVRTLQQEVKYHLAALQNGDHVTCVAGFRYCHSLGWGRFLYVDELVTNSDERSSGAGATMLRWLAALAREAGCGELRLDSAVYRHGAHRFYMRERMDISCFHFRLDLNHDASYFDRTDELQETHRG